MILEVKHLTEYQFSDKVFLEPHYLRFIPAIRPYHQLLDFSLNIDPLPSGLAERTGIEGNSYHQNENTR